MKLNSTFEKISRSFKIEFDELASEVSHNLQAGTARENILVELLEKYLPKRVGIERDGVVIDANGGESKYVTDAGESKQIDIIMYDQTVGTVFDIAGIKHFPCETVIAIGEVKSDIESTRKLQDALEKIKSVKRLDRTNRGTNIPITGPGYSLQGVKFNPAQSHSDQIFGFIFTGTSLRQKTLIEYLQAYNERTEPRHRMNVFCAFNRFLILYLDRTGRITPSAMDASRIFCTDETEKSNLMLLFYCLLAQAADTIKVARPNYLAYAQLNTTSGTNYDLVTDDFDESSYREIIELNLSSLRDYIKTTSELENWKNFFKNYPGVKFQEDMYWQEELEGRTSQLLYTMLRIIEHCELRNYKELTETLLEAENWGEAFFTEYINRFPIHFGEDMTNSVTPSFILITLIIAAHRDRFTNKILEELGFDNKILNTIILDSAYQSRNRSV